MMALVEYSDSEDSEKGNEEQKEVVPGTQPNGLIARTSKPAFQKLVNHSEPHKVGLRLPPVALMSEQDSQPLAATSRDERPAKRPRTEGGFGGFNSLLPAPKQPASRHSIGVQEVVTVNAKTHSARAPQKFAGRVNLKTGATPSFTRAGNDDTTNSESTGATYNEEIVSEEAASKAVSETASARPANEKLIGKVTTFKPLSVSRKPVMRKKPLSERLPKITAEDNTTEPRAAASKHIERNFAPTKPKTSLFATTVESPLGSDSEGGNENSGYGPINEVAQETGFAANSDVLMPTPQSTTAARQSSSIYAPQPQSSDLCEVANNLGLNASERRQLFGRKDKQSNTQVAHFSLAAEYSHNQELIQTESVVPSHNPVRSIAPGKHSLQQLVNAANTQKDALEESFAAGKRNKKDAGRRYGW